MALPEHSTFIDLSGARSGVPLRFSNPIQSPHYRIGAAIFLTALFCLSARANQPSPAAVAVCGPGYISGHLFAPGDSVVNPAAGGELFVMSADFDLLRLPPGRRLRLSPSAPAASALFEESVQALTEFDRNWHALDRRLVAEFPDSAVPDTVEGFLVYPLGARLLDLPEAFKWQGDSVSTRFSLYVYDDTLPVFTETTRAGQVGRMEVDSLIDPGVSYRWVVRSAERQDSSWFQVLSDSELLELGKMLETLDALERQDNQGRRGPFGWTWLKTTLLCRRGLYYEARAQVRSDRVMLGGDDKSFRELLHRVRCLQRYGLLLRPPR